MLQRFAINGAALGLALQIYRSNTSGIKKKVYICTKQRKAGKFIGYACLIIIYIRMAQKAFNNKTKSKGVQPLSGGAKSDAKSGTQTATAGKGVRLVAAWPKLTPWISAAFIAVLAWGMLVVKNSDYLYMAQERSLFSDTGVFFSERMQVVQGFLQWMGCYLTQFFYHPELGSSILIGIWLLTFYAMKRAFTVSNKWSFVLIIPIVALLCSIIELGYWFYYIKSPGYWFTQSLGVLFAVLSVWLGRVLGMRSVWLKLAWMAVWTAFGYPLLGWFAILGTVVMAAEGIMRNGIAKEFAKWGVALLLIGGVPFLWYNIYTTIRIEDLWIAGLPLFISEKAYSYAPILPFLIVAVSMITLAATGKLLACSNCAKDCLKEQKVLMASSLAVIALCAWTANKVNFDDYNFHAEIRMYRGVDEQRWTDVLEEMANIPDAPTRQMVMFKNIALLNTGEMGTKMFKYANTGKLPHTYDSLAVHMVQTAGSMIYYQYGKANFAYRWCVENGVEFGYNVDHLKLMTQCSILSGEPVLAMKYINLLKTTTFHKEWAAKYERMILENVDIATTPEFATISHLRNFTNITDGDQGLCEMYILNYFANTMNKDDKVLQEVTLAYSLIQKDIQLFWPRFFLYATLNENLQMPIHYQEAAYLYGHLEKTVDISKMPFDKDRIVNRYNQFGQISQAYLRQGMSNEQVGEAMKASFGDTFWWFYYFCNNVKSY